MAYLLALLMLASDDGSLPADAGETPPAAAEAGDAEKSAPDEKAAEPADDEAAPSPDEEAAESEGSEAAGDGVWEKIDEVFSSGAVGLLREGGFFMWPILLMAVIGAGVIMERYRSLKMLNTDPGEVRDRVGRLLREERVEEARELCEREQGPVPAVLAAGLRKYQVLRTLDYDPAKIEEQVVDGMDDYGIHIVAALERHLPILATISSAAPMLGFLGTVQGMIVAFQDIVDKMGETNIVMAAAAGIKVSLLTTCFGLIVGIPAFVAFNYFTSVINRFVLDVEESASELIENVTLQLALDRREA